MTAVDGLRGEVLGYIGRGLRAPEGGSFEELALKVYERQFAENEPYRRFCEGRGGTPERVGGWSEIPAVPTAAFKEAALVCGAADAAEIVFRTSGTSQGPERRGAHHVLDLGFYRAAALPNFREHMLPGVTGLRTLILGPSPELAPDSSLSWMFELVRREYGAPDSAYFVDGEGLSLERLGSALELVEARGVPAMLLGTAAAYAHLLETMEGSGRRFRLPAGSRAMETGGFKRYRREIPRDQLYSMLRDRLGLSELYCVAEYGMTEMCSQFYDNVLRERSLGRSPGYRYKVVPPWVRTQVVDAETLELLPEGRVGVLRHFDLANFDSVMAIQTDDLGVAGAGGFEILGRAAGAELRGCSIAMDQWLTAQR
jgi:hypothetical protein